MIAKNSIYRMMNEMIIDNAAFCVEFSQAFLFL